MFLENDTLRGQIRKSIIENSTDEQVTIIPAVNFGDIHIIGENHKEAADYFSEKIKVRRLNCTLRSKKSLASPSATSSKTKNRHIRRNLNSVMVQLMGDK